MCYFAICTREKHKKCDADRRFSNQCTRLFLSTTASRKVLLFYFVEGEKHDNDGEEEKKKR